MKHLDLFVITAIVVCSHSLAHNNRDQFSIAHGETHLLSFKIEKPLRITYLQYQGQAHLQVRSQDHLLAEHKQAFAQINVGEEFVNKDITI